MPHLLKDIRDVAVFWARDMLWQALLESARTLRRHLGKELLLGAIVLALAWFRHEDEAFVDGLRESFVLLLQAAGIYFGVLFLWQLLLAPVQVKRELDKHRLRQPDVAPAVQATDQRIAFKDRVIWLHDQGQRYTDPAAAHGEGAFSDEAEWAADAEGFLREALGEGEASYFRVRVGADDEHGLFAGQGLNHLHDLMSKSDTVTIRPDFDPAKWRT